MIMANGGSVKGLPGLSKELQEIYSTVWEIKQRSLIDMAADRGVYVDQSQSLNAFIAQPDYEKLTSLHFHGWKRGLKTGMYYLRTKPAAQAIQFTVDPRSKHRGVVTPKDKDSDKDSDEGGPDGGGGVYGDACISCSG